jgi:hypothetical protein
MTDVYLKSIIFLNLNYPHQFKNWDKQSRFLKNDPKTIYEKLTSNIMSSISDRSAESQRGKRCIKKTLVKNHE